jgi:hypothetical protein
MTTDLERRLRAGLREYVESVPITPPPLVAVVRPRRARVRRIGLPLLAAATVIAALTIVPVGLTLRGAAPAPGAGGAEPSLPNRFAPYSIFTGELDRAPISRAVAVYEQRNDVLDNWFEDNQVVLVDGDRYRRMPLRDVVFTSSEDFRNRVRYLSPDGRHLAYFRSNRPHEPIWVVLDLASGSVRPFPRDLGYVTAMVAWSPDGRRIAFGSQDSVTGPTAARGRLAIWDLDTGRVHGLDALGPLTEASFSPDGRRIAARLGAEILILDDTGRVQRRLPIGPRDILAGPAAWSPDGALLAVERLRSNPDVGLDSPLALRFVRVDGAGAGPAEVALGDNDQPQGWRGTGAFVVWDKARLVEVSVGTGARTTLAETGDEVSGLHVASGLLSDLTVRAPGDVDRGPWPTSLAALLSLTMALVVVLVVVVVLRRTVHRGDIDVFDPEILP